MKRIIYQLPTKSATINEDGKEVFVDDLTPSDIPWSAENEKKVKAEAFAGQYTIYDDGLPEF